jgi:hypothetical protein
MRLQTGRTGVEIDRTTGAIERVEDTRTGLVHIPSNPHKSLFHLTVPRAPQCSRFTNNRACRPDVVEEKRDLLALRWRNLPAQGEPTGISLYVCYTVDHATGEIRISGKLSNAGEERITEVCFPTVGGWCGVSGPGSDTFVLGGHRERDPHRFPVNIGTTYAKIFQKARADYPVDLYAPWADLSGAAGGLSLIHYMDTPINATFTEQNQAGHGDGLALAFGWRTPCVVAPGETFVFAPVGLSVHGGDWHITADRYSAWMESWFSPPPVSPALREIIGFQNVFLHGFDGTPFHAFDEIPQIAADGRRYGVDHLCLWDELILGNYERPDSRDLFEMYDAEAASVLRRALARAREEGSNVNALVNLRLAPARPDFMAKYGDEAIRLLDGSMHTEKYSATHYSPGGWTPDRGPNCFISSSFAESYRERVLEFTRNYLDLGFTSMFYDQPFEVIPDYGRQVQGYRPEETYGAVLSLVAEVRKMLHQHSPDAYLIGEYCEAFMAQHIDLWMSWYTHPDEARYAAYSIPQTVHSWVVDNNKGQASRAFAMGMALCLCTHGNESTLAAVPDFAEHVKRLAALRLLTASRIAHGRFRDNQGIELKTNGSAEAYAFDSPEGPAVIVAAPDEAAGATVTVERSAFVQPGTSDQGRILRLDGSQDEANGAEQHFELATAEVAVWLL